MKKNPHQFIERLLARTIGKEQDSGISIKPAITPDVLPEAYHLPEREQQFIIPSSLPSSPPPPPPIPSDSEEPSATSLRSSPSQDSSKLSKHISAVPEKENIFSPNDFRTDDISSSSSTSDENNKLDQKRQIIYPEKVYKQQHVPSQLEYVEGTPASSVENQKGKQIKQSQAGSSSLLYPVSPEIYHPMQVTRQRQNLETSQRYSEEPSVTINIGRIDVRATVPQKLSTKTQQSHPSLSLKDYLKQRSEVSR